MAARRRRKGPRWVEIPTEKVALETPLHRADWPRRADLVPGFAERVEKARQTGHWPGEPIRVRPDDGRYLLVSGFSRLAVAIEAELPTVRAFVDPAWKELALEEIHLRTWQEKARLNAEKLALRQEQARRNGALLVALRVRPSRPQEPAGYVLLDGLYWYHIAHNLGFERVPAIVQS